MRGDPAAFYGAEAAAATSVEQREGRSMRRISMARLATALAAVMAIGGAFERSDAGGGAPWWIAAAIAAAGFVALVVIHRRARRRERWARARRLACESGLARVGRDWPSIPPVRWLPPLDPRQQALARDLDVTGEISLFRLLDVTSPSLGGARVLEWLLSDPDGIDVIGGRAASVAALRDDPGMLLDFAAAERGDRRIARAGLERFVAWATATPRTGDRAAARAIAVGSGMLTLVLILSVSLDIAREALVPLVLLAQLVLSLIARRRLEADLEGVDDALTQLGAVIRSVERITSAPDRPGRFGEVQRELRASGARDGFAVVRRILDWNGVRLSPLAHFTLNAVVGLDAQLWGSVLRWRARYGPHTVAWFADAADAEALVALATLGFENPGWAMPTIHDSEDDVALGARAMGHPLIAPSRIVGNDLDLATAGDVIVVSGSNMAGKTTYLRAAGLAVLLAQAGGPVAATALTLRRSRVRTSVRVEDDLSQGVSLFLAEAQRLRTIVADAEEPGPPVLFLLDEILHGTNARDRREATRLVLGRLAAAGAFGLVTTHDPEIAHGIGRAGAHGGGDARELHFGEALTPGESVRLSFDYKARPGPATSTNALAILRELGLS